MTTFILILHILCGFSALLSGTVAIFTKKGKGRHVKTGQIYLWSMTAVGITALYLSMVRPNIFLLLISIFSFYMTWSGYRAIHWKNRPMDTIPYVFNLALTVAVALSGLVMIGVPVANWAGINIAPVISRFSTILLVFGIINTGMAGLDLINLFRPSRSSKFWWMYQHIGRMGGAFIATVTAFVVVNITFLPDLIVWLAPTIVGTPLISWAVRKYRLKLNDSTGSLQWLIEKARSKNDRAPVSD